ASDEIAQKISSTASFTGITESGTSENHAVESTAGTTNASGAKAQIKPTYGLEPEEILPSVVDKCEKAGIAGPVDIEAVDSNCANLIFASAEDRNSAVRLCNHVLVPSPYGPQEMFITTAAMPYGVGVGNWKLSAPVHAQFLVLKRILTRFKINILPVFNPSFYSPEKDGKDSSKRHVTIYATDESNLAKFRRNKLPRAAFAELSSSMGLSFRVVCFLIVCTSSFLTLCLVRRLEKHHLGSLAPSSMLAPHLLPLAPPLPPDVGHPAPAIKNRPLKTVPRAHPRQPLGLLLLLVISTLPTVSAMLPGRDPPAGTANPLALLALVVASVNVGRALLTNLPLLHE